MRILISKKYGCAYTWDYENSKLLYAPLQEVKKYLYKYPTFNTFEFMELTEIQDYQYHQISRIKNILRNDY